MHLAIGVARLLAPSAKLIEQNKLELKLARDNFFSKRDNPSMVAYYLIATGFELDRERFTKKALTLGSLCSGTDFAVGVANDLLKHLSQRFDLRLSLQFQFTCELDPNMQIWAKQQAIAVGSP